MGVFPCIETSPNPMAPFCDTASPNESFIVFMSETKFSFIPQNKTHPIESFLNIDGSVVIKRSQRIRLTTGLKKTEIFDDDSTFRDKHLAVEYFDVENPRVMSLSRQGVHTCSILTIDQCKEYLILSFGSSNKKIITIRKYPKIIEFLGDVGGTSELIYIAISIVYFVILYNRKSRFEK